MSLLCISREEKTMRYQFMSSKFSFLYIQIFSFFRQNVNFLGKIAIQNVCVFAYLCGSRKNNFLLQFRSSFKTQSSRFQTKLYDKLDDFNNFDIIRALFKSRCFIQQYPQKYPKYAKQDIYRFIYIAIHKIRNITDFKKMSP